MKKIFTFIVILLLIGLIIVAMVIALKKGEREESGQDEQAQEAPPEEESESNLPSITSGDLYGNIDAILPFARKDVNKDYVFVHNFKQGETVDGTKIEATSGVNLSVGEVGGTFWQDKAADIPVATQDFKAYVAVNCTSKDFCLVSILGVKPGMRLDFEGIILEAK